MARMTGFVFQDEYLAKLQRLSDEELGRLVRALAVYHTTGETPEVEGAAGMAFDFIRPDVDRIEEQYRAKCETNRRNRRGAEGDPAPGSAGDEKGRPSTAVPKDKGKDKDKVKASCGGERSQDAGEDPLIKKARTALHGLTDSHEAALREYRERLGDELVSYAIDRTVANGAKGWGYTETILRDYAGKGIRTLQDAAAAEATYRSRRGSFRDRPGRTVLAQQYEQREYVEDEMREKLGVDDLFR